MASLTDLIANFGDVIELNNPNFDLDAVRNVLASHSEWVRYNPRKNINRFGLSVTSLDGGYSGVPDLDSLREYNLLNNAQYSERSFTQRTPIVEELGLTGFLNLWGNDLGRTHFLRLDMGGFFPNHRDNGLGLPPSTIRILVPITWKRNQALWIQDGELLHLQEGSAYFVNTSKEHSVFSYVDGSILLVLNVAATSSALRAVASNVKVK